MKLNEYQQKAKSFGVYPGMDSGSLVYLGLKLAGEAGELAEKLGKKMRSDNTETLTVYQFTDEERIALAKELGDIKWYGAVLADALGFTDEQIAVMNIDKLTGRKERGTLIGEGDDR